MALAINETDFILQRLVNETQSAEGAILPLRQFGEARTPTVKNLKVIQTLSFFGGTQFTLTWQEPEEVPLELISHFNIYVFGLLSDNRQPIGPYAVRRSPAEVRLTSQSSTVVTLVVQTVLKNGQVSDMGLSPNVSARTAAPTVDPLLLNIQQLTINGLVFTNNSPGAGSIAWTASVLTNDGIEYSISAGNMSGLFLYWEVGDTTFTATNTTADFIGDPNKFLIATNNGGTHDTAYNKLAYGGVGRTNLGFALLEGFVIQAPVFTVIDLDIGMDNVPPQSESSALHSLVSDSTEGALLHLGVIVATADATLQSRGQFEVTIDGGSTAVYPVIFGDTVTWEFTFQSRAECSAIQFATPDLVHGDFWSLSMGGITYKESLAVKWRTTIGTTGVSSATITVLVRRALKA